MFPFQSSLFRILPLSVLFQNVVFQMCPFCDFPFPEFSLFKDFLSIIVILHCFPLLNGPLSDFPFQNCNFQIVPFQNCFFSVVFSNLTSYNFRVQNCSVPVLSLPDLSLPSTECSYHTWDTQHDTAHW